MARRDARLRLRRHFERVVAATFATRFMMPPRCLPLRAMSRPLRCAPLAYAAEEAQPRPLPLLIQHVADARREPDDMSLLRYARCDAASAVKRKGDSAAAEKRRLRGVYAVPRVRYIQARRASGALALLRALVLRYGGKNVARARYGAPLLRARRFYKRARQQRAARAARASRTRFRDMPRHDAQMLREARVPPADALLRARCLRDTCARCALYARRDVVARDADYDAIISLSRRYYAYV